MSKSLLETLDSISLGAKVKIGGSETPSFIYCGSLKAETYKVAKKWLDREVIETYPSIQDPNTTIIIFRTYKDTDRIRGICWTEDEYEAFKAKEAAQKAKAKAKAEAKLQKQD